MFDKGLDDNGHFYTIIISIVEELCIKIQENIQISNQKYMILFNLITYIVYGVKTNFGRSEYG